MWWGFFWNPSNCECKCDKSCDIGEYLDYSICKCTKGLVGKLVEEWTENIEETRSDEKTSSENKHKFSSCIVCIVLFSIILAINIGTGIYFVYYKYINRNKENFSKYDYTYQTAI